MTRLANRLRKIIPGPAAGGALLAASLLTLAILPGSDPAHTNTTLTSPTLASADAAGSAVIEVAWEEDVEFSLWLLGWDEEAITSEEDSVE